MGEEVERDVRRIPGLSHRNPLVSIGRAVAELESID
jgi:hypothetical protein